MKMPLRQQDAWKAIRGMLQTGFDKAVILWLAACQFDLPVHHIKNYGPPTGLTGCGIAVFSPEILARKDVVSMADERLVTCEACLEALAAEARREAKRRNRSARRRARATP